MTSRRNDKVIFDEQFPSTLDAAALDKIPNSVPLGVPSLPRSRSEDPSHPLGSRASFVAFLTRRPTREK